MKIDPDLVIPNKNLSIREGAITRQRLVLCRGRHCRACTTTGLADHYGFSLDTPIKDLPKEIVDILLYGSKGEKIKMVRDTDDVKGTYYTEFEGVVNNLERRFRETTIQLDAGGDHHLDERGQLPRVPRRPAEKGKPVGDWSADINISELCRLSVTAMLWTFLTSWS